MILKIFLFCTSFQIAGNAHNNHNEDIKGKYPYNPRQFENCFPEIGCIETNEDWYHKQYRPVNLEPLDRHTIRTEFMLLKNINLTAHEILYDLLTHSNETLKASGYNNNLNSIFLIHDFTSNGETGWVKHISVPLLEMKTYNIISIDWESGAEPPFAQAISNARVVALETIAMINILKSEFGLIENKISIIGHGIGAHIAGYVGKIIKDIKKITALDPTGPSFANMPCKVKLTRRDAQYVEVIHTDAFHDRSQGTLEAMGHADFYVNKAQHQPGCEDLSDIPLFTEFSRNALKLGKIIPACSHKRAFKYFIESMQSDFCKFMGVKCENIEDLLKGKCENNINNTNYHNFGIDAEKPTDISKRNRYLLRTSFETPYCLHPYKIDIYIDESSTKEAGYFELIVIDYNNTFVNMSSLSDKSNLEPLEPGRSYGLIFYASSPRVSKIKEARLKWTQKNDQSSMVHLKELKKISVKKINIASADSSSKSENEMCPVTSSKEIKSGSFIQYKLCNENPSSANNGDHSITSKTEDLSLSTEEALQTSTLCTSSTSEAAAAIRVREANNKEEKCLNTTVEPTVTTQNVSSTETSTCLSTIGNNMSTIDANSTQTNNASTSEAATTLDSNVTTILTTTTENNTDTECLKRKV